MKSFCHKIVLPKIRSHRIRVYLCLSVALAALCLSSHAGGSWLADGRAVQTLENQIGTDPSAIHTDGTRAMQAPLVFDSSVSGLFQAYTPWDGMYDFFILDADLEAIKLSSRDVTFYPTRDLYISGTTIGDDTGEGGRVDLGEMTLKGGSWMVDAVGTYDECIVSRGFANSHYVQDKDLGMGILIETSDFGRDLKLHSRDSDMKFDVGSGSGVLEIWTARMAVDGDVTVSGELSSASTAPDPEWEFPGRYVGNRDYNDTRYLRQASPIITPLEFDPRLSSKTTGLFKAFVPWDAMYDFFAFNPTYETLILSPSAAIGFEAGELVMAQGKLELPGEAAVDFMEHRLGGGWWLQDVMDDPKAIIHKEFADNRYIQRTEGITTTHIIQAGDTLQIQNGIITAINP